MAYSPVVLNLAVVGTRLGVSQSRCGHCGRRKNAYLCWLSSRSLLCGQYTDWTVQTWFSHFAYELRLGLSQPGRTEWMLRVCGRMFAISKANLCLIKQCSWDVLGCGSTDAHTEFSRRKWVLAFDADGWWVRGWMNLKKSVWTPHGEYRSLRL
jgi:hypothetical protein